VSAPVPSLAPPSHPAPEVLVLAVGGAAGDLVAFEALLAESGVRVLKASGSREALDLLIQHDVAVAIVDVQMPDMTGFGLAELIRADAPTRSVPIIVLTAAPPPDPGRVFSGDGAGGIDFLVKPVDPHMLRSKVGVFIELSRQRLLLSAQVEQLHTLQRTSELLMGVLGHDLRNPLNAISLAAETLLLARPDDEMAALIARRIRSASQRMGRLIAQSLDFAALRSGSWPIQARDADLEQLCRTAASEFEELDKRGFDCGVQGDPRGRWDPERILHLFSNLIGNALRHGTADAAIAVRIDGRNPDAVAIEVENGGTLPESLRANPFAVTGETRGGAGLGLYIVDQIARAHGGGVVAEASGGRTLFTVRLPRRPAEP
jgi:two-component system, sensor histidine kinase and response regulator